MCWRNKKKILPILKIDINKTNIYKKKRNKLPPLKIDISKSVIYKRRIKNDSCYKEIK